MSKKILTVMLGILFVLTSSLAASARLQPGDFTDIQEHWGKTAINEALAQGWMQGMGANSQGYHIFAPQGTVTRAQTAAVLVRMFDLDYGDKQFFKQPLASDYYQDVDNQSWYAEAVALCAVNSIFEDSPHFYPQRDITRLEMAKAIQNCFTAKKISVPMIMMLPVYDDMDSIPPVDVNAVAFVTNTDIMKGDNGYFRPQDTMTRAELAQVLVNCSKTIKLQLPDGNLSGNDQEAGKTVSINTRTIQNQSENMKTSLMVPAISGLADQEVESALNDRWLGEAQEFAEGLAAGLEAYVEDRENVGAPVFPYEVMTSYQVMTLEDSFLSMYIDYYQYTGGAHGMTERIAYNIDLATGADIALADLFTTDYEYKEAIDQFIQKEITNRPGDFFPSGDMGFNGISDEQPFYLTDSKLVIYFSLYEIAPYAAGFPEFEIPLSYLNGGLKAPFI